MLVESNMSGRKATQLGGFYVSEEMEVDHNKPVPDLLFCLALKGITPFSRDPGRGKPAQQALTRHSPVGSFFMPSIERDYSLAPVIPEEGNLLNKP